MRVTILVVAIAGAVACGPRRVHYDFVMPSVPRGGFGTCTPAAEACPHIAVTGQVREPGFVRFATGLTVVGAIVASGGFTALANQRQVRVVRIVDGATRRYRASIPAILAGDQPDLPLQPGDVIYVLERDA